MRSTITKIGARSHAIDVWRPLLAALEPFDAGDNVKGRQYQPGHASMISGDRSLVGILPDHYWEQFKADAHLIDYIVWSYETPIAWHLRDESLPAGATGYGYLGMWEIPYVRYSLTTSHHQAKIRDAVGYVNAAGGRFTQRPLGPFINLMSGRAHQGITPGWQSGGTPEERGVPTLREVPAPRPEPVKPEWTPELRLRVKRARVYGKLSRRWDSIDRTYAADSPEWHYARSDHRMIRWNLEYISLSNRLNVLAYER